MRKGSFKKICLRGHVRPGPGRCKKCNAEKRRQLWESDYERTLELGRAWRARNRRHHNEYQKLYTASHPEVYKRKMETHRKWQDDTRRATLSKAIRHRHEWTLADLKVLMDSSLPIKDLAIVLGRTYVATYIAKRALLKSIIHILK